MPKHEVNVWITRKIRPGKTKAHCGFCPGKSFGQHGDAIYHVFTNHILTDSKDMWLKPLQGSAGDHERTKISFSQFSIACKGLQTCLFSKTCTEDHGATLYCSRSPRAPEEDLDMVFGKYESERQFFMGSKGKSTYRIILSMNEDFFYIV